MGDICRYSSFDFDDVKKTAIVFWDEGDESENGLTIEVQLEDMDTGQWQDIGSWSFGYEEWSEKVWEKWGEYVESVIERCDGDYLMLRSKMSALENVDCVYNLYLPESERTGFWERHLKDLWVVKRLIATM